MRIVCLLVLSALTGSFSYGSSALSFQDFAVEEIASNTLSSIDFSSHLDGALWQEYFGEQVDSFYGKPADFGGRYKVLSGGCGTMCQFHIVVDVETGKIIDSIETELGACYQDDSRLFITNPDLSVYEDPIPAWLYTSYYQIESEGFMLLEQDKSGFRGNCQSGQ